MNQQVTKETFDQAYSFLESDEAKNSDLGFVKSVLSYYKKWGMITPGQAVPIARIGKKQKELFDEKPPSVRVGGNLIPIFDILKEAKKHKKWPRIMLAVEGEDGELVKFKLYVAGQESKWQGWLQIKGKRAADPWYGRVNPETGELHKSKAMTPEMLQLMKEFAADPLNTATAHGALTGECCFCSKTLTDEESKARGYGPVCAKKHGLK